MKMRKAYLVLADGWEAEGIAVGAEGTFFGEIVFHTALTGYPEIFTDPSYYGQILVMTLPHIGNYGTASEEWQHEKPMIRGLVVRHLSSFFSRAGRAVGLPEYLRMHGIPAIAEVDTRALVRHVRQKGAQNALLTTEPPTPELKAQLNAYPSMQGQELASHVSTPHPYTVGDPKGPRIALLDYGVKRAIIDQLIQRGAFVGVFHAKAPWEEILKFEPAGFLLSNGPGDPAAMSYAVQTACLILQTRKPTLGICLGHQILSLALNIPTYKLLYGHRGSNHPVKDLRTQRLFITSQNHGFAIDLETLKRRQDVLLSHINLNDGTVEGFIHRELPIQGVQYHPEACPGPHDSHEIFDEFIARVTKEALVSA
ncbi:MAG: glutamine-hydrolyzing carbamoyl-phosphate synthase small subunit [Bacteroidia bacterium]|nr:glutamine-hydrolyzing carbamoyl-phosphate synthase small subunit [Bacteroidia bacterium]MDW8133584.1 glutamine-hydrolyzing carbamoyl-phosphate synthase small subunit [Bacteroidia bacterium]